jgi:hypothetical protein
MKMVVCAILTVNTTQHYTFGSEHGNVRNFGNQHHTTLHICWMKMVMAAILTVNTTQHYTFGR